MMRSFKIYDHQNMTGWLNQEERDGHDMGHMGERRGGCRVLVGKPEAKRPTGREGIHERTIKWILKKQSGSCWTQPAWPRIGTSEHGKNFQVPQNVGHFPTCWETVMLSRSTDSIILSQSFQTNVFTHHVTLSPFIFAVPITNIPAIYLPYTDAASRPAELSTELPKF